MSQIFVLENDQRFRRITAYLSKNFFFPYLHTPFFLGISVILPPPKEHQFPPQPAQLASSLKKPAGDASVSKLTTFSSISVDTESAAVVGGGGNTPVVSFGGETILQ